MNGDEQRPSGSSAEAQPQHDAPEPGNARLPQAPQQQGQNGQQRAACFSPGDVSPAIGRGWMLQACRSEAALLCVW